MSHINESTHVDTPRVIADTQRIDLRDLSPESPATGIEKRHPGWSYMPALDGIRALAIIGVLIFHGNPNWLPGGYLGVDVFFVLSGFLISSIIFFEIEKTGKLDFKRFYVRRARRLLPALVVVLFASSVLALFFAQDAVAKLREDIVASLFYVTNWWNIAGDQSYFEAMGRAPMLQHLWSLAVEEQFYLLWPIVLVIAYKWRGRLGVRRVALIGALLSTALMFAYSIAMDMPGGADPSRLYFGTDTHAMGLLLGAALASVWRPSRLPQRLPKQPQTALSLIGLGAIGLISLFYFTASEDSWFMYRGGFLLFAAITAVLIAVSTHPAVRSSRVLSIQPLKYIGQRSYGIYLWHWPIFVVLRPGIDIGLEGLSAFALQLALTFTLAELSYRFIEQPVRNGAIKATWAKWNEQGRDFARKRALIIGSSVTAVLVLMGAWMISIPAPDASAYLGGVESVGTEPLEGSETNGSNNEANAEAPVANPDDPNYVVPYGPNVNINKLPVTVIGDSVVLGARESLKNAMPKATVDAEVARQTSAIKSRIVARQNSGKLANTVVIHTGTNGPARVEDLRAALDLLKDTPRVVLVTTKAPLKWIEDSNRNINVVAGEYPNVRVADWSTAAAGNRDLTVYDGTHLTGPGGRTFAQLIVDAIKQA
ncbi:MAG: acyltransferase family protein [Candidatus Nanopelagicales bacterium]